MIKKIDRKNKFVSMFNPDTGFYMRSGIIDENGKDTGEDPFMTSYPELLDIGIMQTCVCAHKCNVDCYQKAIERTGNNMSLEDFESIMNQSKGKLFQCLDENEIVLVKKCGGYVQSKYIGDVKVGDFVYCGSGKFSKIIERFERSADVYDIELTYGKHIIATGEHKFPVLDGLKTVEELNVGDILLNAKNNFEIPPINRLDIVKMIIERGLGEYFYLTDCNGLEVVCKKYGIYRNANKTVRIDKIQRYLSEIDYSNAFISKERSQYKLKAIYDISESFMTLLGHYIGNGSTRRYVVSSKQKNMIESIERGLKGCFPNFEYKKVCSDETCIIELNSSVAHSLLFDKIFECRTNIGEKQLPNFIYSVSNNNKMAFLKGYFCDGNIKVTTRDGNYGGITFNTSSEKLAKDICILLVSMGVDYSVHTESEKQDIFSKNEPRIINRKKRYRISIQNLIEISKIQEVVSDHKDAEYFNDVINQPHELKYLRNRKKYEIKSITRLEKKHRVVDINIASTDHLFVTSHGIISHNCALGGAGDVDTHENFEEILKMCREYNIVPNFTTSGILMTKEKADICKKYCGAVAVSEHFADYTDMALDLLLEAGVKTNIHYVLSNKSIDIAIDRLKNNGFKKGINAVVFLLYKPVGLGVEENVLKMDDERVKEFFRLIDTGNFDFKIGFDSCTVPALINFTHNINQDSFDTCEGGRWSAYITADMKMLPCSFDNQDMRWAVDLKTHTIQEAWDSEQFEDFRDHFKNSCGSCDRQCECRGGCPIRRQIVLCDREEKNLYESSARFCH